MTREKQFKHLNNQELINTINKRFENNLNDDDYIYELVQRKKEENFETKIKGNKFILITKN